MSISFFSPIYPDFNPHPLEKCHFLQKTTHFFDFGQKGYTIQRYDNNARIEIIELNTAPPTWIGIALRIIACLTLIIPMLMLIGALIYRGINNFQLGETSNKLDKLPDEILIEIFGWSGPYCLKAGSTCKKYSEIVEKTDSLKKYRIILRTLEESYIDANTLAEKDKPLSKIVNNLALMDPLKAVEIVAAIIEPSHKIESLSAIAEALFFSNPEYADDAEKQAIRLANAIGDDFEKALTLATIAKALSRSKPVKSVELADQALAIINSMHLEGIKNFEAMALIAKATANTKPQKALELLEQAFIKLPSLEGEENLTIIPIFCQVLLVFKVIFPFVDLQKAATVLNCALEKSATITSKFPRSLTLACIAPCFSNPQRQILLEQATAEANQEADSRLKSIVLAVICAVMHPAPKARETAEKALALANNLPENTIKYECLIMIAGFLEIMDPQNSENILEEMIAKCSRIHGLDKAQVLGKAADELSFLNPVRAIDVAKTIDLPLQRSTALSTIALKCLQHPRRFIQKRGVVCRSGI